MKKQIKRITAVAAAAALAISFTFPAELGLADLGVGGNAIVASAETSGDFEYSVDSGNVRITRYIGSGGPVDIPATIDGKPVTSIGEFAFQQCSGITSINIPNSVTSIQQGAFSNCSGLSSITIPSSVTSIENTAFWGCSGLTSINIPSSVTSIGVNVFYGCIGLTGITVDSSNTSYCSESGVLFNKDKTTLIYYPLWKTGSYTIPDGVTVIEQYAFYCNSKLTSVTIPSSVTSIGESAFQFCSKLTIIYIPNGISIGSDAIPSTAGRITYTVDSSNNVTITDIRLYSGNRVDIPATIDGKTVIAVNENHQYKVGNHTCVSSTAATCINKATCGICGQDYYGDHDLSHHDAVPPTCTTDGNVEYWECSLCQKDFSDDKGTAEITDIVKSALGHSLIKTDEKAPTCTDDGNRAYWTCTECGNIFSDDAGLNQTTLADVTVSATNHNWSSDWSSDGTGHWHDCTNANCPITENNQKDGYAVHTPGADATETTPQTCDVCGYELAPALGHIHTNHLTFIAEVPETCTADGVKAHYECECGKLFADDQAATEVTLESLKIAAHHTYGTDWESDNDDDHYHVCSVCSDKADVTPHSYDNGVITTPATETTEGVKTYTCSVCHHTKTETVPKLSHTHSLSVDYSKDETGHWHTCSGCTEKVDFEAHTEDSGTVTVQPTETTEGIRVYSCTVCGYVIRTETVPALASEHTHSYGTAWKYDSTNHWHECSCGEKSDISQHISNGGVITVPPTATTAGVRVYSCYICGYAFRTETIPATGYDYYPTYPSYPAYPTYPTYPVFLTPSVFTEELTVNAEADGSMVTLSWDKIENADKYYVYQYKDGKYVKIKTTTDTSVTLKGLKNGETYKFLVRYSIGRKLSPMTYSYKITVKVYYKPIAKAASTENSVKLTWQAVPNAEKYAIYKYVDGKAVKLCETEKLAVRINKLAPDTEYQYIVRAYVDGKWTTMTKSDIVTVNTNAE